MPTYVELCEALRSRTGVQGVVSTTVDLSGRLLQLANFVKQADQDIQRMYVNWKFLWADWSQTLTADSTYLPPVGMGMFDIDSFWMDAETVDAVKIEYIDWNKYREEYREANIDAGFPWFVTIRPEGKIQVVPSPDTDSVGSVLSGEYWRRPVPLVSDDQVSIIPEQFHEAIIRKAEMMFFEFVGNTGRFTTSGYAFAQAMKELKSQQLPGNEEEGKSRASSQVISIL